MKNSEFPNNSQLYLTPEEKIAYQNFKAKSESNRIKRATWHDYRSLSSYLITILKNTDNSIPRFSTLKLFPNHKFESGLIAPQGVSTEFTAAGWAIHNAIQETIPKNDPFISRGIYVIMPDHIHIIMQAKQYLPRHLSDYIAIFKSRATQNYRNASPAAAKNGLSLFSPGYNDRIISRYGQLDVWSNYIRQNPWRLYVRHLYPDYFKSIRIPAEGSSIQTYGNQFILSVYPRLNVRFSSSYTEAEWAAKEINYLREARNGTILVSPWIHKKEKEILEKALILGGRVMKVQAEGFGERGKPTGLDFFHCLEGRMLIVCIHPDEPKPRTTRSYCLAMNEEAAKIARHDLLP